MSKTVIHHTKPNPKQAIALRANTRYVAFGGARGGGKSHFVRDKADRLCWAFPGIKVLVLRRTMSELRNNHILPLQAMLGATVKYNQQQKAFLYPNGSRLEMGYCNNDGHVSHYQGAEYDVIFFDEAGLFPEDWLVKIDKAVRGVNTFPKRTYYTLNPGGVSHNYFRRKFVQRQFTPEERPEDYTFVQSLVTDNAALLASQPDYLRGLEALPPRLRAMWLEGSWDVFEGMFFEDFAERPLAMKCAEAGIDIEEAAAQGRWTHVIRPFDLLTGNPRRWQRYRSYDFGYGKPFSCNWYVSDEEGRIYMVAEMYGYTGEANVGIKWSPDEQFRRIAEFERTHPWFAGYEVIGVADPSIWDSSRGESVADTAARHGVFFTPGDNARIPGWMQCHYRLQFDEQGIPMFYVFDTCTQFIRTLPLLQYSTTNPEDLETSGEDHAADSWRYQLMTVPIQPQHPIEVKYPWLDPLSATKPLKRRT